MRRKLWLEGRTSGWLRLRLRVRSATSAANLAQVVAKKSNCDPKQTQCTERKITTNSCDLPTDLMLSSSSKKTEAEQPATCWRRRSDCRPLAAILPLICALALALGADGYPNATVVIVGDNQQQQPAAGAQPALARQSDLAAATVPHLQPSYVFAARNKSMNFTHLKVDELTGSIYIGATNWLFQLSATNLRPEVALRTGPASENSRDCAPADCQTQLAHVDAQSLPVHHAHNSDLSVPQSSGSRTNSASVSLAAGAAAGGGGGLRATGATMHTVNGSYGAFAAPRPTSLAQIRVATSQQQQQQNNNYNKILAIDPEARQLIVCGSLNQGACRRHQLGALGNYSDLIALPVASNDEHSSSVALVSSSSGGRAQGGGQQKPVLYVAATNTRLGPYREMVPAISARYLEPSSKSMQIIDRSFTDSAHVDISFELRDYYLVNYIHAFQHNDYVYFATVQRKSPLRQLEEWGYITRLARLCLSDLSFQSYTEMTLECRSPSFSSASAMHVANQRHPHHHRHHQQQQQQQQQSTNSGVNYNLLQDAYLTSASSHLAQQLGIRAQSSVLVGAFAQSKDHTTRSQSKSAICLFPMERIEQKFNENIHICYNGSSKARNMNYIAGSVNDCPKPGKAGNIANFCNEPLKLNGSLPLVASPVIVYDNELITAIAATQAPTGALSLNLNSNGPNPNGRQHQSGGGGGSSSNGHSHQHQLHLQQQQSSQRQHQVLIAGTATGALKRIALVSGDFGFGLRGQEFDSIQVDEHQQEQILADLHLLPSGQNPQLALGSASHGDGAPVSQFAIVGTPHKVAKLRINSCKAQRNLHRSNSSSTSADQECNLCAHLQDPFCGWCASSSSCTTREECLAASVSAPAAATSVHWSPFDQIRCSDYQPLTPRFVALQTSSHQPLDINIRVPATQQQQQILQRAASSSGAPTNQWTLQLAQAQFTCHYDYLTYANKSLPMPRLTGATTKGTQARLNVHTSTVVVGCPLPAASQRPALQDPQQQDHARVKLTVRLAPSHAINGISETNLQRLLGLKSSASFPEQVVGASSISASTTTSEISEEIEREFAFYDCAVHTSCRSCLSAGQITKNQSVRSHYWSCSWCPLGNRCTFNASHPDFGCAASAVIASTTPNSAQLPSPSANTVRASHLTASLDEAQANMFGLSIDRLAQCPAHEDSEAVAAASNLEGVAGTTATNSLPRIGESPVKRISSSLQSAGAGSRTASAESELLIAHNSRRSIQVTLKQPTPALTSKRPSQFKLECLLEVEGAKARMSAKLLGEQQQQQQVVVCQESAFTYQEEIATQRAQLLVILNDNQVIDVTDVILYKCHLFGVNPPALTSTVGAGGGGGAAQHSSAVWRAHEFLQMVQPNTQMAFPMQQQQQPTMTHQRTGKRQVTGSGSGLQPATGDCSMCANVERKFQCVWCQSQCQHADQCNGELIASTCPPPRIHSIHPTSGPLEGGTLLTIEGSNLGSNEREIQDKISIGGERCQLVMYSVSTRIVCKTGPSLLGPQAATVHVGNRAGVTSAYEKFHYKAVHLTDVNPRIGPVSGGTRLYLSGSNLNVGSRVQIFLDDIPCALDSGTDLASNQITCVTAPNLVASSMRITKLTLMIDNSTHYLPYPFTYQPDPIITSIEPAESFISGGRLILISGYHLSSPQSTKIMVYHEHRRNIVNGTSCITQNDTLVTCLTPAISRDLLASLSSTGPSVREELSGTNNLSMIGDFEQLAPPNLSYESGGLKLKIMLFMDDVRSVRNLDEYYHHLPHYITYYEDPQLFRLANPIVDYTEELVIPGENLKMRQIDQDILVTIGVSICTIKSVGSNQIVCEPPEKVPPVYDDSGRPFERPLLQIVALIGSNLRFQIGHMQYHSSQYQAPAPGELPYGLSPSGTPHLLRSSASRTPENDRFGFLLSQGAAILLVLSVLGFVLGFTATLIFAFGRFRQSKAEREYKRIQLQMGSLDINGQPVGGAIFDKIHLSPGASAVASAHGSSSRNGRFRALDYVVSGKRLLFHQQQVPGSFPSSPFTDISSLTGSNQCQQQQQIVQMDSNGTAISSSLASTNGQNYLGRGSTSQSSPMSATRGQNNLIYGQQNSGRLCDNLMATAQQNQRSSPRDNRALNGSRNFNWTQDAPSTIVPYAVIEACDLTLEGKNAIKDYV